jgi:hypothetical protein
MSVSPLAGKAQSGGSTALRAGTAIIDITPENPVQLAGYGSRKELSTGIHDRLSARAIVFENAGRRLVIVSSDLIGWYGAYEFLSSAILEKFSLQPSELFLSAIHTHSAPILTIDKETGHANNLAYTQKLKDKLLTVIGEARQKLAPVTVGAGVGSSPVGVNRRQLMLGGEGWPNGEMVQLGRNPGGVVDRDVHVMKIADPAGETIAVFFDYACHATSMGPGNLIISGDILGLAEQFVEKILGDAVIAPAFAGASGDIDPWYRVLPTFNTESGWIPEPVLLGTLLGEEVVHVFRDIGSTDPSGIIRSDFKTLSLPAKPRGEKYNPQVEVAPTQLNLTVARIGDIGFVGVGGEVLTEIGMAIKAGSPFEQTFIITHCNGAAGYLPTAHEYPRGGYEVNTSPFAPQAADMVTRQALTMLYHVRQSD